MTAVIGAVLSLSATPAHAAGRNLSLSGVTGHVAGLTATGTKIKVGFVVENHTGARTVAKKAVLSLVGHGHTYALGTVGVPALTNGASRAVSAVRVPSASTVAGDYAVRVCLTPRPAGPCAQSGAVTVRIAPAKLTANPTSLALPATLLGAHSAVTSIVITNTGQSVTGLVDLSFTGVDTAAFALKPGGCHATIAPGRHCTAGVVFTPAHSGASTATLVVRGRQGGKTSIRLSGEGTNPDVLVASPTHFAFPDTPIGQVSTTQITLTNNSSAVTGPLTISITGAGASQYTLNSTGCPASPSGLAVGASCDLQVQFKPTTAGDAPATVTVTADPGGSVTTTLTGRTPPPSSAGLALDPTSHDFGNVAVGTQASFPFTLTNNATQATGALTLALAGAQASSFSLDPGTCTPGLAPGAHCTVTVTFKPTSGSKSVAATLSVTPTTGTATSASLTGGGLTAAALGFSTFNFDFGGVTVGQNTSHVFTLTNNGEQDSGPISVTIGGTNPSDYVLSTNNCTTPLAPGASCSVTVKFAPTTTGTRSATLTATATPGGSAVSNVTGNGT